MTCRLCEERGKNWSGDDPECAFEDFTFSADNWNCATMNRLRNISEELKRSSRCDMSCGSIGYVPVDNDYAPITYEGYGGYIVMMWYKERGRTGNAMFMTDEESVPLTLEHVDIAIESYENRLK
jgi:hypothetical protein